MVAGATGVLSSSEAVAQTAAEERKREKEAAHVMTVATAYAWEHQEATQFSS